MKFFRKKKFTPLIPRNSWEFQNPFCKGRFGDSNWRAAGNVIKKKRNLNETGLKISGCRHGLA